MRQHFGLCSTRSPRLRTFAVLLATLVAFASSIFAPVLAFAAPSDNLAQPLQVQQTSSIRPNAAGDGTTWYVALNSSNGDGQSWEQAWNELERIGWEKIKPGDTIRVRQGTYRTPLDVRADGTPDRPIQIVFDSGTILFGGRSEPLPDCDQKTYSSGSAGGRAINLQGRSYIIIDGQQWNGLKIHGWQAGIEIGNGSHDLIIRNSEVTNNGVSKRTGSGWQPSQKGVRLTDAFRLRFERLNVHDNGGDSFQANGNIRDITFTDVWMHNSRGMLFNGCAHPDGLQITGGYQAANITFERVVSGPYIYHTVLTGESGVNFRFTDILVFNPITSTFACRKGCSDWQFSRITSDGRDGRMNFELSGTGHSISNSLVTNGRNKLPSGVQFVNNFQHDLDGERVGTSLDPNYRNAAGGDFTPQANVNGAGSCVHSVNDLLAQNGARLLDVGELALDEALATGSSDEDYNDQASATEPTGTEGVATSAVVIPSTNDLGPMKLLTSQAIRADPACETRIGATIPQTVIHLPLVSR